MSCIKNIYIKLSLSALAACLTLTSCEKPTANFERPEYTVPTFSNPVMGPSLFNASVLRTWDGWFYAYGSEENWVGAGGNRLMPVMKSTDMVNWTFQRNIFNAKPTWRTGLMTSPEVIEIDKQAHVYYTFGNANDVNVSIGIANALHPAGPYTDRYDYEEMGDKPGNLLDKDSIGIEDPRHPFYYEEVSNKSKYLFWNSSNAGGNSGVYGIKLSNNGLRVPDFTAYQKIATGKLEGITIHKRTNYYYLFGTKIDGTNSAIVVGRSESLLGPYLDKTGKNLNDETAGTIFATESEVFKSMGHTTRIFTDKENSDWIMFHAVDKRDPVFSNNAEKKPLILAKISWNADWPEIEPDYLTAKEVRGPNFY